MVASPTHRTSKGQYDGGAPVVWNFDVLNGVTTASSISKEFIAPFSFKLKEILFNIHDTLSSTTFIPKLLRNGSVIASVSGNGVATGFLDLKPGSTTTFVAADYLINRGDRLKFSIPNLASCGGQGVIVGNPL